MFVDEVELEVRGGDGGAGAVSFRRERYVPRGGPDGGDGGRGGSVYAVADGRLRTLNHLQGVTEVAAGRGVDGGASKRTGAAGEEVEVRVPTGTALETADGETLGELVNPGERALLARGGRGGRGNCRFATATMRAPRYAEKGRPGQTRRVVLTLKIIADVALVGPPNAGKSSLLAAMSAARPKVAAYPFTTLAPQLGIVEVSAARAFAAVEVPGLLEGAAEGRGLGHDFLRHVERVKIITVVVDAAAADAAGDCDTVLKELGRYEPTLVRRVKAVAANKIDLGVAAAVWGNLKAVSGAAVFPVSAVTGAGVPELRRGLLGMVEQYDDSRP